MTRRRATVLMLAVALLLAFALSPFASPAPDGLERVAIDAGFADRGRVHDAPVPGYAAPAIDDPALATALAGLLGTLLTSAAAYGLASVMRRRV